MSKVVQIKRITIVFLAVILMLPILSMDVIATKSVPVKPGRPTSFKATVVNDSSIKLTWKRVKNAKKYEIYRAEKKNGKYTKIKTTSERKYMDTGRTAGKTYCYKVRAYRMDKKKKIFGAFSTAKKATTREVLKPKPIPMTSIDEMLKGTVVSFVEGVNVNTHCSDGKYSFDAAVAFSYTELKEVFSCDYNPNRYNYIQKYNENFFEENAVICLFITRGSGSIRQQVDSLVRKGDELCIGMTTVVPEIGTCDMSYWRIILEVRKTDITDVTKISVFEKSENF